MFKGYPNLLGSDSDRTMRRNEYQVALSAAAFQVLSPNPRRVGCILGFNMQNGVQPNSDTQLWHNVDVSVAATLATLTVPNGYWVETLDYAVNFGVSLKFTITIQRGATVYSVYGPVSGTNVNGQLYTPLIAGDIIQLVNSTTGATTSDGMLAMKSIPLEQSCNIWFSGKPTSSQGITIRSNNEPVLLWRDVVGDAISEGCYGICQDNVPFGNLYVMDLFT